MSVELATLARTEGRLLARHPLTLAGLALSFVLMAASAAANGAEQAAQLAGMGCFPLAAGVLLAANAAGLRSRRDGTDELFAALPSEERGRRTARLAALGATVPLSLLVVAVQYLAFDASSGLVVAYDGMRHVPAFVELAQGPATVIVLGALGLLLARWAPSAFVGPPVVVILLALEVPLAVWGSSAAVRWALPIVNDARSIPGSWVRCAPGDVEAHCNAITGFDVSGMALHLVYLALAGAGLAALTIASRRETS